MSKPARLVGAWAVAAAALAVGCGDNRGVPSAEVIVECQGGEGGATGPRVLVWARENLWNHGSNAVAVAAIANMCETAGVSVVASRDENVFSRERLAEIDVVVFAVTSGETLGAEARQVLGAWLARGGGLVGIHSASATDLNWPTLTSRLGPAFRTHGAIVAATLTTATPAHPVLDGVPARWPHTDEWYNFVEQPELRGMRPLLVLDEASLPAAYPADLRVGYHALAWAHEQAVLVGDDAGAGGTRTGRTFYTALGHTEASYETPAFLLMLKQGIEWAGHYR